MLLFFKKSDAEATKSLTESVKGNFCNRKTRTQSMY